jgi:hypothetical protein
MFAILELEKVKTIKAKMINNQNIIDSNPEDN